MMKHTFFTLFILLSFMAAQAAPISETEARSNVLQFLNTKGKQKIKGARSLTLVHTIYQNGENQSDGSPMLYIFNVNGGQGYVVAAADDVALPILAYGNEGGFSQDNIPDNVMAWLQGYADQIAEAKASGAQREERPAKANRASVPYMVQVQWDQRAPYNAQCVFDGHQCPTGCGATAMAQIMYYWAVTGRDGDKFRHGCQALDSYTMVRYGYEVPALDALDSFDWNAMDEGTVAPQSDAAKQAVAQLMRYCGQAAHTNFAAGESNIYDVISGMKKFGYDSDMRLIETNNYLSTPAGGITYDEWDKVLYNEIKKGRPVLMGVNIPKLQHLFICDGYEAENNSFHLNWGWSGENDGYYVLSATLVNSGATADNFFAVVGIEPEVSTYGVLSLDNNYYLTHTLTLYHDNKKGQRSGEIIERERLSGNNNRFETWYSALGDKADELNYIVIDKSFKYTSEDLENYFSYFPVLMKIKGLEYLDTYGAESFSGMFEYCECLLELDLSHFDTSYAVDMSRMFNYCMNLSKIDLSSFNTSNVKNMDEMFNYCCSLYKLDVSNFDTSNVERMWYMFKDCRELTELDLSNFIIKADAPYMDEPGTRACYTVNFLTGCNRLHLLHISPSMGLLDGSNDPKSYSGACYRVGKESYPCIVIAPSGFDFGTDTSGTFCWKGGWFHFPYPVGDVNHDNTVTLSDIMIVIDYILKSEPIEWDSDEDVLFDTSLPRFYYNCDMEEADLNHDRNISLSDVMEIVDIILK